MTVFYGQTAAMNFVAASVLRSCDNDRAIQGTAFSHDDFEVRPAVN